MTRFIARIRVLGIVLGLVALVIVGRLYYLQIMQGSQYAARADAQFVQQQNPLLDRGSIYFTDKDGTHITAATVRPVASSASTTPQHQRYYPGGSLAAQELGFVAYNNDNTEKGRYGLERYYDQVLGRSSQDLYQNFFVELFSGINSALQGQPQEGDVITTLEPSVQADLERELAAYQDEWHSKLSGGIIMNPQNGEIYAIALNPTFDLNSFNTQTDPLIFANPMAENVYEMGSIIKPLTMAAGIDSGAITPATTYNDTGCITVETHTICNYDLKARGVIPMQQILSQSLNVGASFVATQMGPSVMRDYFLNHYQFNQETGIDLPGELHGLTNNLQSSRPVEFDTAAFGQGLALTPVETVRALATLSNGGLLVTPHLARAIRYTTGITQNLSWAAPTPVLKPETAAAVSQMLTTVVDTTLAHGAIKNEHHTIAAKTGTAQIVNPATGQYYTDRYLHSYFGYFPTDGSARFIIFLFALEPVGAPYASETWSAIFHDLTLFLINYYNVPPDR